MHDESRSPFLPSPGRVAFAVVMLIATGAGAQPAPEPLPAPEPADAGSPDPTTDPAAPANAAAPAPAPAPVEVAAATTPTPAVAAPAAEAPVTYPSMGKGGEIKLSDAVWFRIGVQGQTWAHFQQSPAVQSNGADGGYSRDLFFRRARVLVASQLAKIGDTGSISAFLNLESSNLGKAVVGPPDAMMNPTAVKTDGSV